jgi:hypothetical protein
MDAERRPPRLRGCNTRLDHPQTPRVSRHRFGTRFSSSWTTKGSIKTEAGFPARRVSRIPALGEELPSRLPMGWDTMPSAPLRAKLPCSFLGPITPVQVARQHILREKPQERFANSRCLGVAKG